MTAPSSWRTTRLLIESDLQRFRDTMQAAEVVQNLRYWGLLLTPELACLALYRVSHHFFSRKRYGMATFLYRLNITLTGADIHPATIIGPRCLLVHPTGTVLFGTLGQCVTIYARVIVTSQMPVFRIAEAPWVGDEVVLGAGVTLLGDIEIAPHCHIAPASLIDMSILDSHSMVSRMPGERLVKRKIASGDAVEELSVPGDSTLSG
jgi:serine O-acetyltransferase